jgi:hypothetical protein
MEATANVVSESLNKICASSYQMFSHELYIIVSLVHKTKSARHSGCLVFAFAFYLLYQAQFCFTRGSADNNKSSLRRVFMTATIGDPQVNRAIFIVLIIKFF